MSEPVVPSSGGPGGLVAFVVTVEQHYANTFGLEGVFATEAEARTYAASLRLGTDVKVYRCDGPSCEELPH
jgi:hypothetical protein